MHRLLAKTWDGMSRWERMVFVLYHRGPMTSGALGHIYGIGENVRGIRIEANHGLRGTGWHVDSRKAPDAPYHTYELVNVAPQRHVARTNRVLRGMASGNARVAVAAQTDQGRLFHE